MARCKEEICEIYGVIYWMRLVIKIGKMIRVVLRILMFKFPLIFNIVLYYLPFTIITTIQGFNKIG